MTRHGVVETTALTEITGASAITIRRDLHDLAEHGLVTRTRGGAVRAPRRGAELPFASRASSHPEEKARIAQLAATLVDDDESVIIDNGTTCLAVATALAGRPLTALALSLHAAAALASHPQAAVVVPGGLVQTDTLACTGVTVLDAVRGTRADVAILGACSASPNDGLTATTHDDAVIKTAAIRASTRRVLVTTLDKLTRSSTFRFGDLEDLTHLVTTTDAPRPLLDAFAEAGVQVHLA